MKRTKKKDPKSFWNQRMTFFYNGYSQYKNTWFYYAYLFTILIYVCSKKC